jgi:uncharacterized membrane protein
LNRRYWGAAIGMLVAVTATSLYVYPSLPARVPTHWNLHGEVNAYGSRGSIFVMPVGMAILLLVFRALPWLSPKRFEVERFYSTYLFVMVTVTGLFTFIFAVMLWAAVYPPVRIERVLLAGLCVFTVVLGSVLSNVRRNFWIGIRTPWTLADERVWDATHRLGGRMFIIGGLAGLIAALVAPPLAVVIVLGAATTVPVVYSLVLYKRLNAAGHDSDGTRLS